ncbi:hypothetical protein AB9N36_002221 [Salmonella enterica]|nr:hypothetical protein [Salmonella enterica]
MRMNHMSLNRKWILFSLVLLSPAILAAENLNFNYTRADALSMDSRLGLQAKACHSLGDTINLNFRLGSISIAPQVILYIKGKDYSKSYRVFEVGNLTVPFNIKRTGSASGTSVVPVYHPGTTGSYNTPFCFSDKRMANLPHTQGYIPLIKGDAKTGADFETFCRGIGEVGDLSVVWGGDPRSTDMPANIKAWGSWTGVIYFMTFTPGTPDGTVDEQRHFDRAEDSQVVTGLSNYSLPLQYDAAGGKTVQTVLDKANFTYYLNNRNITELKVIVRVLDSIDYKWEWTVSRDNPNLLHLKYTDPTVSSVISPIPNVVDHSFDLNPAKDDPYAKNSFYANAGFYKGTLASRASLNQNYQDYIKNVSPLSLPPDTAGDINLANTGNLTFTLRSAGSSASQGYLQLSVYGEPLQFAPLVVNGKEVASAMQVRNACY